METPKGSVLETDEKRKAVLEWLNAHWPKEKRPCPICGQTTWNLSSDLWVIARLTDKRAVDLGTIYPSFTITCTNCAYTMLFNAVLSGIWQVPQSSENEGPTNG